MKLTAIQYAFPEGGLLLIALLIFLALYISYFSYRNRVIKLFNLVALKNRLALPRSRTLEKGRVLLIGAAWSLAVVAWMQPRTPIATSLPQKDQGKQALSEKPDGEDKSTGTKAKRKRKAHDVYFLIDTSASMSVKDTRQGLSRLDDAKDIIEECIRNLTGQSAALYAFTSQVSTISPPTMDYLFLRLMLKQVGINEGDVAGTDLVETLEFIRQRFVLHDAKKLKTLIILTDGGDTRLEALQSSQREQEITAIISRLGDPQELNFRVFTIGIGTPQGEVIPDITFDGQAVKSSLDEELLKALAEKGRGKYYYSNNFSALAIANDIRKNISQDDPYVEEEVEREPTALEKTMEQQNGQGQFYELYFQLFLGLAILCLAAAIFMPTVATNRGNA